VKPFHVAIDIRRLRDFGVGTYIRNLVQRLGALDHENQYSLIATESDPPDLAGLPPNFRYAVYHKPAHQAYSSISLPLFLRALHADVYHVPLATVPFLMPRPYVVTVHDMSSLIFQIPAWPQPGGPHHRGIERHAARCLERGGHSGLAHPHHLQCARSGIRELLASADSVHRRR
jgi:hypothetical protein